LPFQKLTSLFLPHTKVEWGTLLFFGALFVLMKALDELGLMDFFADFTAEVIAEVDEGKGREAVAIILILWVSAFVSAFIGRTFDPHLI
jgi:Na+/H+ antiporter NhaD/arsenite permease-like protein